MLLQQNCGNFSLSHQYKTLENKMIIKRREGFFKLFKLDFILVYYI